jgi:hypothetical protein
MAEPNHEDLADALARLAGGEVAPSEREHEAVPPPPPALPAHPTGRPVFRPTAPAAKGPPAPRSRTPVRPSTPASTPPQVPPPATAVVRPQRPAVPPARPLAPPPPNLAPPEAAGVVEVPPVDDDDVAIVPAPDASVFAPRRKPTTTADARAKAARHKRIEFRRTLIPILLTCGVLSIAFAVVPLAMGTDSVAVTLPGWITPTLLATGAVLLVLAGLNMAGVRAMLAADGRSADGPASH